MIDNIDDCVLIIGINDDYVDVYSRSSTKSAMWTIIYRDNGVHVGTRSHKSISRGKTIINSLYRHIITNYKKRWRDDIIVVSQNNS